MMTLRDYLASPEGDACVSVCFYGPNSERCAMSVEEAKTDAEVLNKTIDRNVRLKSGGVISYLR